VCALYKLVLSVLRDSGGTVRGEADSSALPSNVQSLAGGFPVRKIMLSVLATAVMLALSALPVLADTGMPGF
jgi:hypothetical protein